MQVTALFKLQFLLQLLVGEGVFLFRMERREQFRLRCVGAGAVLTVITLLLPSRPLTPLPFAAQYLFLFLCTLAALYLAFAEPFQNLLLCGIGGYTIQHLSYLCNTVLEQYVFADAAKLGIPLVNPYGQNAQQMDGMELPQLVLYGSIHVVFYLAIYFLIYITAFDLFDPLIRSNHDLRLGRVSVIFLSGLLIFADVIFNMMTLYHTEAGSASWLLELVYNVLLCLLTLLLLYHQISQRALKDELASVQYLLDREKSQYESAKKTAELINIKYHDLRHQYERQGSGGYLLSGDREELKGILEAYDVQIRTGNEVLDVILTEKNLLCRDANIQLICMADGAGLDFVKPHHLYALLSNAIDNAVEAVRSLPEEERFIHLYIRRQGQFYHIQVENVYSGSLMIRNGLPATQKEDQSYHGFGMLSMKTVAERYDGSLSATAEDGVFCLDVLLTAPTAN